MATAEVKEEQKVYVCLPGNYDDGKHILSWTLSHFPKDETKIVATYIGSTSVYISRPRRNQLRERINETLDKHLAQCAVQKFKAEKLIHEDGDVVEVGILELIDLRAIKNLVMLFSPTNSQISAIVAEKANPSCKIWFISEGNLLFTRNPKSDLTEATSEEQIRKEKRHQKEIEEIQKRENDKNDLLKRENEQLKLEQLRNQQNENYKVEMELQRREKLHQRRIEKIQKRENNKNDLLKRENEQLKLEQLRHQQNDNYKVEMELQRREKLHQREIEEIQKRENDKNDILKRAAIQREKLHQKEIEEIQKRENDKNDLLKRENEQLKLENQLQQNEFDKQKQQLRELISDLEIGYNKLEQERDNQLLRNQRNDLDQQKQQLTELISDFGNFCKREKI